MGKETRYIAKALILMTAIFLMGGCAKLGFLSNGKKIHKVSFELLSPLKIRGALITETKLKGSLKCRDQAALEVNEGGAVVPHGASLCALTLKSFSFGGQNFAAESDLVSDRMGNSAKFTDGVREFTVVVSSVLPSPIVAAASVSFFFYEVGRLSDINVSSNNVALSFNALGFSAPQVTPVGAVQTWKGTQKFVRFTFACVKPMVGFSCEGDDVRRLTAHMATYPDGQGIDAEYLSGISPYRSLDELELETHPSMGSDNGGFSFSWPVATSAMQLLVIRSGSSFVWGRVNLPEFGEDKIYRLTFDDVFGNNEESPKVGHNPTIEGVKFETSGNSLFTSYAGFARGKYLSNFDFPSDYLGINLGGDRLRLTFPTQVASLSFSLLIDHERDVKVPVEVVADTGFRYMFTTPARHEGILRYTINFPENVKTVDFFIPVGQSRLFLDDLVAQGRNVVNPEIPELALSTVVFQSNGFARPLVTNYGRVTGRLLLRVGCDYRLSPHHDWLFAGESMSFVELYEGNSELLNPIFMPFWYSVPPDTDFEFRCSIWNGPGIRENNAVEGRALVGYGL